MEHDILKNVVTRLQKRLGFFTIQEQVSKQKTAMRPVKIWLTGFPAKVRREKRLMSLAVIGLSTRNGL